MKLAGRCVCGVSDELVARDPDAHLPCLGLRWCGRCGEAAEYRADCLPCKRGRARETARREIRLGLPRYERQKARKRERYATDAAYAEAKRARARRRAV